MPTPPSSELARLLPGAVGTSPHELAVYARDLWPLSTARARAGEAFALPDAVVRPRSVEDVSRLLAWCSARDVAVVPYGGGSGVCGGVLVDPAALRGRDAVVCDLKALRGVEAISRADRTCTVLAGTLGMDFEEALGAEGLTGGHYPQSLYPSTVGGWLACRSAGQASTRYGKGEDLVAGMDVVLASGDVLSVAPQPSSAAGPDLLRLFCGSEGTLGVIVRATLRVVDVPGVRLHEAWTFASFAGGLDAVRTVVQAGLRPAVVRMYDETDTAMSFPGEDGCLLVCVFEGTLAAAERDAASAILDAAGARPRGPEPARRWEERRFHAAYQLATVMRPDGVLGDNAIADTMEVAAPWSRLHAVYDAIREALGPLTLGVLAHASHVYADGACLYFTFAVTAESEAAARERYAAVWEAGMEACLAAGATITHHHGVGRLKARWLRRELGETGWTVLSAIKTALDPSGILNPGALGLGA